MKIAYLITAHEHPAHFKRMIRALDTGDVRFFVHLDAKSDLSAFDLGEKSNLSFIADRIFVNHSGFTLTQAFINLIRAAYRYDRYDYFISLSGRDYPIKSNRYIRNYLNWHAGTDFINFYPLVGNADLADNIRKYHFIDPIARISGGFRFVSGALKRLNRGLNRFLPDRHYLRGVIPYRGSVWWGLTRSTVGYLVRFIESRKNRKFIDYFKWANCSDEIFFQTVILNSPHARHCRFFDRDILNASGGMKNENKAYLHYVDWNPVREDPAVLDMRDYGALASSAFLFARKFGETESAELLDRIDHTLLTGPE